MTELITAGEPMGLFIAQTPGPLAQVNQFECRLAGADLNVAIGVARLQHTVQFITQIGQDVFGQKVLNLLKREQIATTNVYQTTEWSTGMMLKGMATNGQPEVDYYRKASAAAHLSPQQVTQVDFERVKILHLGGILAGLSEAGYQTTLQLIKLARQHQVLITFDPNLRPTIWESTEQMIQRTNEIARLCDVIMPNIKEAQTLTGMAEVSQIAEFYLQTPAVQQVIINLIDDGAYSCQRHRDGTVTTTQLPTFKVEHLVDKVGAGDGFVAGVLTAMLENLSVSQSLQRGLALEAIQMQHRGDNEGLPTPTSLEKFLQQAQ